MKSSKRLVFTNSSDPKIFETAEHSSRMSWLSWRLESAILDSIEDRLKAGRYEIRDNGRYGELWV